MNMFRTTDKFHLLTQKAFKNPSYQLKQSEYLVFWDYIQENSDNVIYFLTELTHMIMHLEHSKKSYKIESLDSMIATLYCISMFKKILGDKKRFTLITELDKEWQAYDKTKDSSMVRSPYSSEIVNCVFQILLKNDEKSRMECILNQICMIPSAVKKFLNVSNNTLSLSDIENATNIVDINEKSLSKFYKVFNTFFNQYNTYHKQMKQDSLENLDAWLIREEYEPFETGECSFVYEYFITFLNENKKKKNSTLPDYICTSLLTNLKIIPYIATKYPKHAESSLCCLFNLIKQIIVFFPLGPTPEHEELDLISLLISLIKVYKTWPFPIGFLATELIDLLEYEAITIGNSFRYKIREEIPALDVMDYELHKNENYLRIAYCIFNDKYQSLITGLVTQNSEHFNDKTNNFVGLDAHKIRVLLIAHLFSLQYRVTKELLVHLSGLNPRDIFAIYCKLLNILERCEKVDSLDIKNLQEKALDELANEIFALRTENSETSYKIQDLLFQEFQSFIPIYPDVYLQIIDHRQNNINLQGVNQIKKQIPPNFNEEESKEELENEENGESPAIQRKIFGNFTLKMKELLEEIKQISLPLHQESFKLVVFGEDIELHYIVQELGVLFKLNYLLFTNIDLRIYVIPLGKCTMGKFIACKDLLYNRCVYLPFNQDLLIPKLDVHSDGGIKAQGLFNNTAPETVHLSFERSIFPFFIKEKLLQTYLREANRAFQVKVYEILCFKQKNNSIKKLDFLYIPSSTSQKNEENGVQDRVNKSANPSKFLKQSEIFRPQPNETYFMAMFLEIGEGVEFEKLRNERKITGDETFKELRDKGLLRPKGLELEIHASYPDFEGILKNVEPWRGFVQSLKINNIYKDGFEGNSPMPNADFVEMSLIDYENSKQKDYSVKHANLLTKYGREQLQNAFFALNMSFSIYSAVITEINGKEFDILVDGKVYGGFQQIIVQPLISLEKKDFKFMVPIMTFLPLNL